MNRRILRIAIVLSTVALAALVLALTQEPAAAETTAATQQTTHTLVDGGP